MPIKLWTPPETQREPDMLICESKAKYQVLPMEVKGDTGMVFLDGDGKRAISIFGKDWDELDRMCREYMKLKPPYKKRVGNRKGASDGVTPLAKPELQIGDPLQDEPAAPTVSSDKPYTITVELMFKQGGIAYGDIVNIEGQVWQWLSTTGQMHAMVGDEQLTVVQFKERYDGKTATVTPAEKDK